MPRVILSIPCCLHQHLSYIIVVSPDTHLLLYVVVVFMWLISFYTCLSRERDDDVPNNSTTVVAAGINTMLRAVAEWNLMYLYTRCACVCSLPPTASTVGGGSQA
jgi:hypothetical protein